MIGVELVEDSTVRVEVRFADVIGVELVEDSTVRVEVRFADVIGAELAEDSTVRVEDKFDDEVGTIVGDKADSVVLNAEEVALEVGEVEDTVLVMFQL